MTSRYSSDSLEDRLQEASLNAQNNRGRNRTETLRPLRQLPTAPASDRTPRPNVACITALPPDTQRILDYQRNLYGRSVEPVQEQDPKALERRPGEIVNRFCNICSEVPGTLTWCVHPEHEGVAWDLLQDAKVNRGRVEVEGKELVIDQPPIKRSLAPLFRMIHPQNLCTLLTENVQEVAAHWMQANPILIPLVPPLTLISVFTINGTLLGYSDGTTIEQGRTTAALTGAAWRINNNLLVQGVQDIPDSGPFLKNMTIFPYNDPESSGTGLKSMLAEVNGMVIAVHDVKERLLVAAMHPVETLKTTEADEASEKMKSLHVFDETDPAAKKGKESEEGEGVKRDDDSGSSWGSDESESESTKKSKSQAKRKGKGKATGDEDTGEHDFSKKELLMMRVEGMVDVLRADLADFKMPDEFY